jgi:acid stress-induced BolA-like protein IbaG/YrbA
MHYFRVPKLWNITIGPKMMFGSVSEYFANLRQVKRCKTCVSGLNALFRCTEVVKHPFYSIGPKMMFGSVSEYFTNLRQVKRCKTCVSGLNALSRGTEVVKHPFYSIGPKMIFRSVSEHFTNLWLEKDAKLVFRALHYFWVPKLWRIHSTPLDPNWCLGEFQSILLTFDM